MKEINSYKDLPNQPCAMYLRSKSLQDVIAGFEKLFGREPEEIYVHKTGYLIPMSVSEYNQHKALIAIYVPGE